MVTSPYIIIKSFNSKSFKEKVSVTIAAFLDIFLLWLKYLPKGSVIVTVNNSKMILYPKKGTIHRDLYLYKKRECICTDHLIHDGIIKEGDVVLDAGANIGYYTLIESKLVGTKGTVYAVEPVKSTIELLKINVKLNNLKNVKIYQLAFGGQNRESTVYVSSASNLSSMNKESAGGKILDVQPVSEQTVDTFLEEKLTPKLIRMDVEGYEYEILKGMPKTLKCDIKILVELHPVFLSRNKLNEIFKILQENDFMVRFAIFEDKVKKNRIVRSLYSKSGVNLPLYFSNISLKELQLVLEEHPTDAPNVLLEKSTITFSVTRPRDKF